MHTYAYQGSLVRHIGANIFLCVISSFRLPLVSSFLSVSLSLSLSLSRFAHPTSGVKLRAPSFQ
jgi:hypothetical protein